jgi:protein-arginine kinase activator protein McsA
LKCERCGEREAEVLQTDVVRTAELNEAQTQHLCPVCAKVDPAAWQAGLEQMLKSGQDWTPEQRSALEGLANMLRQLRPDAGGSDSQE